MRDCAGAPSPLHARASPRARASHSRRSYARLRARALVVRVPTPAHERQVSDVRRAKLRVAVEDSHFRPVCEVVVLDEAERDLASQSRREDGRGDAPDFAVFCARLDARVRGRLGLSVEDEAREPFGDVAAPVYARDYLLPRVAALRIAHRLRLVNDLDDDVRLRG